MGIYNNLFFTDSAPLDNESPVLIFLHGFFMNCDMFKHQVSKFQSTHRVLCCDIRGFGKTTWDYNPYSLYDIVDDLVALTEYLGISHFTLGGMSMGGYIALRLAMTHPHKITGLILIATQASKDNPATVENYLSLRNNWEQKEIRATIIENLLHVMFGNNDEESITWKKIWSEYDSKSIYHPMNAMLERDDIEDQLRFLRLPVIVIHGSLDEGIPLAAGEKLCQHLENAKMFIVEGAAHAVNLTHPEQTNLAISTFIKMNKQR